MLIIKLSVGLLAVYAKGAFHRGIQKIQKGGPEIFLARARHHFIPTMTGELELIKQYHYHELETKNPKPKIRRKGEGWGCGPLGPPLNPPILSFYQVWPN